MLTPRTGQPPDSLPPDTTLNFADLRYDEQPGTDFDKPFGISWFDRWSRFFERICYTEVHYNAFLTSDRCADRFASLKLTSTQQKIDNFCQFQPHPILMGYKDANHLHYEVPPPHRPAFDAEFAKMLARDIMHIRKHYTTASPYLVTPFYQMGKGGPTTKADGTVIGKCVRNTVNFINVRAGATTHGPNPANPEHWLPEEYRDWDALQRTYETVQVMLHAFSLKLTNILRHKVRPDIKNNGMLYSTILADEDFRLYLGYKETLVLIHCIHASARLDIAICSADELES